MTLPDKEKRGGLKDEVLAGQYVLGAVSDEVKVELAKRVKKDRQFAAVVRRWQDNLKETKVREKRTFASYMDGSIDHFQGRTGGRRSPYMYGRFSIVAALWNSTRFWRLTTLAAILWGAVLFFTAV